MIPTGVDVAADETLELQALRRLAEGPVRSQRTLAESLGVSLGKAHYVIRALVARGLVTVEQMGRHPRRIGSVYLLTPKGIGEKTRLTCHFLQRKLAEYDRLQQEIDTLAREVGEQTAVRS